MEMVSGPLNVLPLLHLQNFEQYLSRLFFEKAYFKSSFKLLSFFSFSFIHFKNIQTYPPVQIFFP